MPELPEVETVRLGLRPVMEGARIEQVDLRRGDLRKPFPRGFAKGLTGRTIAALERRAKYLVARLDDGSALLMHLGMSGSFRIEDGDGSTTPGKFHHERSAAKPHDHVVFHLSGGKRVVYNDPRRFGLMDLVPGDDLDAAFGKRGIGIEPLGPEMSAAHLAAGLAGRRTPVKAALLDQKLIAGLGNIYVCEALWLSQVSPLRQAADLADAKGRPTAAARKLARAIPEVLAAAVAAGGSSLRNYSRADGSLGSFQHHFRVYDQAGKPCPRPRCRGVITRIVQAGRSTFYCPVCQK